MTWTDFRLRLRALLSLRRAERDLDEELRFHLEMQARRNVEAGMSPGEAARHAALDFGGFELAKEECRDFRGVTLLQNLAQDVRYAFRGFRHSPVFSLTIIATIALALGLNTALFTLFNAYLLHPLAVRDPASLYTWSNSGG